MSISPAQMVLQVASAESTVESPRSAPTPLATGTQTTAPAATLAIKSSAEPQVPAPAASSAAQFSTDLQVDNHHQIYYAVVDDSTGDVLFEIPSEALRKIGESLNVPLIGDPNVPTVDEKS